MTKQDDLSRNDVQLIRYQNTKKLWQNTTCFYNNNCIYPFDKNIRQKDCACCRRCRNRLTYRHVLKINGHGRWEPFVSSCPPVVRALTTRFSFGRCSNGPSYLLARGEDKFRQIPVTVSTNSTIVFSSIFSKAPLTWQ